MKIYTNISGICICSLQSAGYQALYLVPKPIPTNRIIYLLQPRVSLCVNYVKSQVNFQMYSLLCSLLFLDVCCYCGVAGTRLKFHHLVNEIASDFLHFSTNLLTSIICVPKVWYIIFLCAADFVQKVLKTH